jgi:hypothetical protein
MIFAAESLRCAIHLRYEFRLNTFDQHSYKAIHNRLPNSIVHFLPLVVQLLHVFTQMTNESRFLLVTGTESP